VGSSTILFFLWEGKTDSESERTGYERVDEWLSLWDMEIAGFGSNLFLFLWLELDLSQSILISAFSHVAVLLFGKRRLRVSDLSWKGFE
jgi:hypothetical protein